MAHGPNGWPWLQISSGYPIWLIWIPIDPKNTPKKWWKC
jgi:hypothetical protein